MGSETLNLTNPGTTTITVSLGLDYSVLIASVTLIAGILIFLTIDWRRGLVWKDGVPSAFDRVTLIMTFGFAGASILFALYPESDEMLLIARYTFIISVFSLTAFAINTILRPPRSSS